MFDLDALMKTVRTMTDLTEDNQSNGIEIYPNMIDIIPIIEELPSTNSSKLTPSKPKETLSTQDTEIESMALVPVEVGDFTIMTFAKRLQPDFDLKVLKADNHTD